MVKNDRTYVIHESGGRRVAEVSSEDVVISSPQDALDILGDLFGREIGHVVLREHHVAPGFFDLKTGLAGEVLQKCSNYGLRLALVGDFSRYPSESLQAFIRESNRGRIVYFAQSVEEALNALCSMQ